MAILGAHMSIAGGYYKAVDSAAKVGCDCVQVFTKNNNQWRAKPITNVDVQKFEDALKTHKIGHSLSHASYLINLASPKADLLEKSIEAMIVELQRADQLGIPFVVVHPGSHTTDTVEQGIETMIASLDQICEETKDLRSQLLLENTAGQGTNLGWSFEQLHAMIDGSKRSDRLGVCIDTCHAFAAGYSLENETAYAETFSLLEKTVGLEKIRAFHLNDSKKPFASRKDRHENIGEGEMGLEPFRLLLNDPRFQKIPMYLETPKGTDDDGNDLDETNLHTLRSLIGDKEPKSAKTLFD